MAQEIGLVRTFGAWEFTCNRAATIAAYSRAGRGGSDSCTCNGCRNFVATRDQVFPDEFVTLLESLGIDPYKDGEVYHNARLAPGRHDYGGWFHFVGTLEKDGDFPTVPMAEGFSVWLCRATAPALDGLKGEPLVQLEFHCEEVPWVLREPEPE